MPISLFTENHSDWLTVVTVKHYPIYIYIYICSASTVDQEIFAVKIFSPVVP